MSTVSALLYSSGDGPKMGLGCAVTASCGAEPLESYANVPHFFHDYPHSSTYS